MSLTSCLIVMLGGALGTLARYVVSVLAAPISRSLPWGTILINASGSFLIGFFGTLTLAQGRFPVSDNLRLFVMIDVCVGYTTFRTAFSSCIDWRTSLVLELSGRGRGSNKLLHSPDCFWRDSWQRSLWHGS